MSGHDSLCTFHRDGEWCGRPREDESVHVWPNERMRPGAHVWRHDDHDEAGLEQSRQVNSEFRVRETVRAILAPLPQASRERVIRELRRRFTNP